MQRVDPRDEADLLWLWNEAEGEIKSLRSLHAATVARLEQRWACRKSDKSHVVYVPSPPIVPATAASLDGRALAAASRERRILRSVHAAGPEAELVLRLRFREVMPVSRFAFCLGNFVGLQRGAGTVAHLTDAAKAAHDSARTTLDLGPWLDRLGARIASGKATALDRALQREVAREAEVLVLWAVRRYRDGAGRVPEQVRRLAQARAA